MLGERNAIMARDHMNVEVEDGLARRRLVELHDENAAGAKCSLYGASHLLCGGHHSANVGWCSIEKIARGVFRHDERMALRLRHHVHEGQSIAVFIDLVA